MKTVLYINDGYCTSLEQLKNFFAKPISTESNLGKELITLQYDGVLADWLDEGSDAEKRIATELRSLKITLTDSEMISQMRRILVGGSHDQIIRPRAASCLKIEAVRCVVDGEEIVTVAPYSLDTSYATAFRPGKGNVEVAVTIDVKVLKTINECYDLMLKCDGVEIEKKDICPKDYTMNYTMSVNFTPHVVDVSTEHIFEVVVDGQKVAACSLNIDCGGKRTFVVDDVSFTMVSVEGGEFSMGATPEQVSEAFENEKPSHKVKLSDYYIGQTPVTQALWQAVMGSNPSNFQGDLQRPVECVCWDDPNHPEISCMEFINRLNKKFEGMLNGKRFRLPTEAEWEFAARGGNKGKNDGFKYSGGNSLDKVAWNKGNSHGETQPVQRKDPNQLDLYDMSGNVSELCKDWYDLYDSGYRTNPIGPLFGSNHVYRGGSWLSSAESCRVSFRNNCLPTYTYNNLGLRLAL